jgi:hypothetical protein
VSSVQNGNFFGPSEEVKMENYIVRIYRRDARDPARIVGIVEEIGGTKKRVFKNFDELWLTLIFPNVDLSAQGENRPYNDSTVAPCACKLPQGKNVQDH